MYILKGNKHQLKTPKKNGRDKEEDKEEKKDCISRITIDFLVITVL